MFREGSWQASFLYMSSFANGISESEIESILSLDDDVLYDIFEFHAPPIRKLPVALWSRIKYDLRGYMVEKEVDDMVASSSCLWSYSCQNQLHFKKDFVSVQIAIVRLISEEHVCVSFEGMSYVDVYNLFSGDLAERRQLKDKVKFMVVSGEDADKRVLNKDELKNLFLVIAFEMGSISVFKVKLDNKVIELSIVVELPDLSFKCTALRWNSTTTEDIFISTEDGSVLGLVVDTKENIGSGTCLKSTADSNQVGLRIIEYVGTEKLIGIGMNGHVYFASENNLYEIKGSFQSVKLISHKDNMVKVSAFSKGTIHYFMINTTVDEQGYYQLLKMSEADIHFDYVTYIFQKGKCSYT